MAARHFGTVAAGFARAADALASVTARMSALAVEYRAMFAPCGLVLFTARDRSGRVVALYWGRAFDFVTPEGVVKKYRRYLSMPRLTHRAIYMYARRWEDREVFDDFDHRRIRLNNERKRVVRALECTRLRLRLAVPAARVPSTAPPMLLPMAPCPEVARIVDRLWGAAWACAAVEADMMAAVREYRRKLPPYRLFPYAGMGPDGYLAVGWALPAVFMRGGRRLVGRKHLSNRLSEDLLRTLGVAYVHRSTFIRADRALDALRVEHARYALRLGAIKRLLRFLRERASSSGDAA